MRSIVVHQQMIAFHGPTHAKPSEQALEESAARSIVGQGIATARTLASSVNQEERLALARAIVHETVCAYWAEAFARPAPPCRLRAPPPNIALRSRPTQARALAESIGTAASSLDPVEAGYHAGLLYTAMLPRAYRARLGAYYTPPALCERLLDMATLAGVDWATATVLDPACGGGAFLSPIARRMARALNAATPQAAIASIGRRLTGFELDPFAAWMSQVFVEATLGALYGQAGTRPPALVRACNSLEETPTGEGFDLVVGNPPYGRVKLPPRLRTKFARSLYGHANLYGVFTDQALRFARRGGLIAYLTPTSFLAGEYFKALRGLLGREAPPKSVGFVGKRKGVFAEVLQETLLAVYKRGGDDREQGKVFFPGPEGNGGLDTASAGTFHLPMRPDKPWLVPRTQAQDALLRRIPRRTSRLTDLGYTVNTGPLVWNRHKSGLREGPGPGCHPLVWAESVRSDGTFEFRAAKRNHRPFFRPTLDEQWVVTTSPCVLLQRTTAKEQNRRLIAAELPASFLDQHGAVVVENHLNMIRPRDCVPKIAPATLVAVLNSTIADQIFRCINGSVAVSAYELHALPLPAPENLRSVEQLVSRGVAGEALERAVTEAYQRRTA